MTIETKYNIGDEVEWVRYGGLFGKDGFRLSGKIIGFGYIGEYLWLSIYCMTDGEIYRVEAERVSPKKNC